MRASGSPVGQGYPCDTRPGPGAERDRPGTANVAADVWAHAATGPDSPAIRAGRSAWSYADLVRRSGSFAARLRAAGLAEADRVLLVAPTSPEFVRAYLGILASGMVAVTVNPLCSERELGYFVDDAGCGLVVAWHETAAASAVAASRGIPCWTITDGDVEDAAGSSWWPADRDPADPAVLLYTSGTTGRPKGAVLTHGNIAAATGIFRTALPITSSDRLGTALPLFHVFGQVGVLGLGLAAGASVSLLRPFSGLAQLRMVAEHDLTVLSGVPTMWIEMLHAAERLDPAPDITSLRIACSGGAALPVEIGRAFTARFGAVVLDGYALSETAAAATFRLPGREPREGSVGQPLPGIDVTIVDERGFPVAPGRIGEVTIAGPVVTPGYWNDQGATDDALRRGRLWTGDLGRMDADDYVWIVDRKKDLVIRGGYNVYPREVEEVLYAHPAVREAAVLGVPDPRLGEEIAAMIAVAPGADLGADELRAWLDERLAAYKVPRLYQFVAELPKGPTGKVLKRAIDKKQLASSGTRTHRRRPAPSVGK